MAGVEDHANSAIRNPCNRECVTANIIAGILQSSYNSYRIAKSKFFATVMQKPFENILGEGENAGNQHFLLFPSMISKVISFKVVKSWDCVV